MSFVGNLSSADLRGYLNFHSPTLEQKRAAAEKALLEYGQEIEQSEAYEAPAFTAEALAQKALEAADTMLAEEVRDHLRTTQGPMLPFAANA